MADIRDLDSKTHLQTYGQDNALWHYVWQQRTNKAWTNRIRLSKAVAPKSQFHTQMTNYFNSALISRAHWQHSESRLLVTVYTMNAKSAVENETKIQVQVSRHPLQATVLGFPDNDGWRPAWGMPNHIRFESVSVFMFIFFIGHTDMAFYRSTDTVWPRHLP